MQKFFRKSLYSIVMLLVLVQSSFALNTVELSVEYVANPAIGKALSLADIYVGTVDLDPKVVGNQKQISVLQENGTTVQVSQPISTSAGGVPLYNGSPVTILVEGSYSLRIDDSAGSQVYYVPQNAVSSPLAASIGTIADLKAIAYTPDDGDIVNVAGYYLATENKKWQFQWVVGDLSTEVAADTYSGIYVGVTAIPTTTGAFVRATGSIGVYVSWFGTHADGVTDDYPHIQAAIDYAYPLDKEIRLASAVYYIGTTLNLALKEGVIFKGESSGGNTVQGTVLSGYAAGKPVLDICGSMGALIQNLFIKTYTSTTAILMGYNTGGPNYQFFTKLKNIHILDATFDITTNNNLGTAGIVNIGGENCSYEDIFIRTVCPMILSADSDVSWIRGGSATTHTFASDFVSLPANWTCGQQSSSGYLILQSWGQHRPALSIWDANDINFQGFYTADVDTGSGSGYEVGLQAEYVFNSKLHWLSEQQTHAMEAKNLLGCDIQVGAKDNGDLLPAINFYGAGQILGTDIKVQFNEIRYAYSSAIDVPFTGSIKGCNLSSDNLYNTRSLDTAKLFDRLSYTNYWSAYERYNFDDAIEGITASTPTATPVIIFTPVAGFMYNVYVHVLGGGTAFMETATVMANGTAIGIYNKDGGATMDLTVSGSDIVATQTSGSNQSITYVVKKVNN